MYTCILRPQQFWLNQFYQHQSNRSSHAMGSRTYHSFEVRWLNGEAIDLRPYSCRICENTDIAWVINAVANVLDWPASSLSFVVGHRHFEYIHRIAWRGHKTLLALREECLRNGTMSRAEDAKLTIYVACHAPPDMFWSESRSAMPLPDCAIGECW